MMLQKHLNRDRKSNSNKKVHNRVHTQIDQIVYNKQYKPEIKRNQKLISSKPKYIDVFSKCTVKDVSNIRKNNFKIYHQRNNNHDKYIKTQTDEIRKQQTSSMFNRKNKGGQKKYDIEGIAGKGTFGVVYYGHNKGTGQRIAIKKVLQDHKYKNRQHQILKILNHPNTLEMKDSYITYEEDEQYLNIIMDYYNQNLYQVIRMKQMSPLLIKLYTYQMFRGLNYLAMLSIAHRDIKPQNILVDRNTNVVVICDFGSAKQLVKNETNLAYICSRCYRAPELIFGATDYNPQIDIWSAGCVMVEMINGHPPFLGDTQVDQLIQIIKVLGTPSKMEVQEMNPKYDMKQYCKIPLIKATSWSKLLEIKDPLLIDLITKILQYSPKKRITPAQILLHDYFAQFRNQNQYNQISKRLKHIPNIFNFTQDQLIYIGCNRNYLIPAWVYPNMNNVHTIKNNNHHFGNSTTNAKRSVLSYSKAS